ncbi:MAG: 50S ribosomal protein L3 [Candidatus Berkelbacteria bacterium]|nr:50S ribosomal protein L3 [Candidatus Berkelbacteria bacterium]
MKFVIGQKNGMTRVFDAEGRVIAVTAIKVLSTSVTKINNVERDGYTSVQVTAIEKAGEKEKIREICEFRVEDIASYKLGQKIDNEFEVGDVASVSGVTKGKGFAGTIKRHGFKRGPEGHGGNNVREPGSIGAQQPQRVVKGRRMAGRMGGTLNTISNIKIVDSSSDVILLAGSVPGPRRTIIKVISK